MKYRNDEKLETMRVGDDDCKAIINYLGQSHIQKFTKKGQKFRNTGHRLKNQEKTKARNNEGWG